MNQEDRKLKAFQKWFNRYVNKNFGRKCPDFVWTCPACHAHFVKEVFNDFVDEIITTEKWFKKTKGS